MYKAFLIKYAEIGVKGNNKRVFEDALVNEVKRALKKITGEFTLSAFQNMTMTKS